MNWKYILPTIIKRIHKRKSDFSKINIYPVLQRLSSGEKQDEWEYYKREKVNETAHDMKAIGKRGLRGKATLEKRGSVDQKDEGNSEKRRMVSKRSASR